MKLVCLWAVIASMLLVTSPFSKIFPTLPSSLARANTAIGEDFDVEAEDDLLDGFEDEGFGAEGFEDESESAFDFKTIKIEEIQPDKSAEKKISFGGFIRKELNYSPQKKQNHLSKVKTTVNLKLDAKPFKDWKLNAVWNGYFDFAYQINDRDDYTDEVLETYEKESELRDLFVEGPIQDWLRIKFGRQVIAWGESMVTAITDIINPRDYREIAMVDTEDSRIPVTATKLSGIFDFGEVDLVVVHEMRSHKLSVEGSEYDPFIAIRSANLVIRDEGLPANQPENNEVLVRIYNSFNGGDLSIIAGESFQNSPYLDFRRLSLDTNVLELTPKLKRYKTLGTYGSFVAGSWIFQIEIAYQQDMAFARKDISDQMGQLLTDISEGDIIPPASNVYEEESNIIQTWAEKTACQAMVGIEYTGFTDLSLLLELSGQRILEHESYLSEEENSHSATVILRHNAWNNTLNTQVMIIAYGNNDGNILRLNIDYDIVDALQVNTGFIEYDNDNKDGYLYPYRDNDRLFLGLKYSF